MDPVYNKVKNRIFKDDIGLSADKPEMMILYLNCSVMFTTST